MKLRVLAGYFARTPLSQYKNGKWVLLRVNGIFSTYTDRQTAEAFNAGDRRLLTNKVLPASATIIRMEPKGEPYLVGSQETTQQFAYFVHRAPAPLEVWRATKTTDFSGVVSSVSWAKVESVFGNPNNYVGPATSRTSGEQASLFDHTVFAGYTVNLPSDSTCTTEDEIRQADGSVYVVQNLKRLNNLLVAYCSKRMS